MKKGRSLTELAQEIERQQKAKMDFVAPTQALTLSVPESSDFAINDPMEAPKKTPLLHAMGMANLFSVTKHAHTQLGAHLGIPKKFYDEMLEKHPDLLAVNVNTLLRRNTKPRLVRTLDGQARAILSNGYRPIDNDEIAPMIFENLSATQADIVSCEITDTKLYIKALFPRAMTEIKVGDPVQMGIVISNSEIGMGQISFEPLLYRLICSNGAIMPDRAVKRRHLGSRIKLGDDGLAAEYLKDDTRQKMDEALILQLRDAMRAFAEPKMILEYADKARAAGQKQITGDPVAAVQVLQKKAGLTDDERGGIMRHLITGGDLSQWGLANAVTRHSQDVAGYDRATELEVLGGTIIELDPRDWKAIAEAAA